MDPQKGPPPSDLLIGQTIGNYLVTQKLGEGGMGAVYLAEHPTIGKKVALKVLHSEFSGNAEVAERFFHEAKAVNDIGHPNIVDIHDYGVLQAGAGREQLVYFIMEYLAGLTLSDLIRAEAPLPPERAFPIALQVADALSASHKCGIVHRDLKPDNIILLQRGRDRDFVKLLDFGIAKLTGDAAGSSRTRTGIVMGTPAYMSPEQCEGRGSVDLRTDVYALGIVVYEMLTGRVPFIGEGYGEILVQHLTQPPVPPSQYRMLPPHVEAVVLKALEKRAELRYPTMEEMMRALADPVGYIEAHGGIAQFMQRQLMPSSAPLPSVRLTPSAYTPLPGTIPSMHGAAAYLTPAPTTPGAAAYPTPAPITPGTATYPTPSPTTLSAAAGQVSPARSKTGLLIAGLLVVAGAGVGIAVVLMGKTAETSAPTTGIAAAGAGSDRAGGDKTVEHGSAATPAPRGSNAGSAGSDGVATGSAGSGSAGSGSAGSADPVPAIEISTIRLTTKPSGAAIFIDGEDQHKKTPEPFQVPRSKHAVTITLKLDKYEDLTLRNFSVDNDVVDDYSLVKKRASGAPPTRGGNTGRGNNTGRGSTTRPNDTGLERPD